MLPRLLTRGGSRGGGGGRRGGRSARSGRGRDTLGLTTLKPLRVTAFCLTSNISHRHPGLRTQHEGM